MYKYVHINNILCRPAKSHGPLLIGRWSWCHKQLSPGFAVGSLWRKKGVKIQSKQRSIIPVDIFRVSFKVKVVITLCGLRYYMSNHDWHTCRRDAGISCESTLCCDAFLDELIAVFRRVLRIDIIEIWNVIIQVTTLSVLQETRKKWLTVPLLRALHDLHFKI